MPNQGDILLVPIPFTDLSAQKRRPVIVISNNAYNQSSSDLVVVAMTSNPVKVDYSFTIVTFDLVKGTLNHLAKCGWIRSMPFPNPSSLSRLGRSTKKYLSEYGKN
jgi:mRNA-degrading endonuclease toxin of MazEF toxin-antitoxin module